MKSKLHYLSSSCAIYVPFPHTYCYRAKEWINVPYGAPRQPLKPSVVARMYSLSLLRTNEGNVSESKSLNSIYKKYIYTSSTKCPFLRYKIETNCVCQPFLPTFRDYERNLRYVVKEVAS